MNSFEMATDMCIKDFIFNYGHKKYDQIKDKIVNSKRLDRFLIKCDQSRIAPLSADYIYCLHEIPYFLFAKPDTIAMGASIALWKWHNSFNKNYLYMDELQLIEVLMGMKNVTNTLKFRR